MTSNDIRKQFLDFFENRGHRVVPSSSLVPANDPTLLFTNAGMNQFKDVFLGREKRDYARACSSQKCVRAGGKHNDLEQVGRTTRHHTFFEMLGNFSFGDYFKKEAIPWAWELVTRDFAIPKDKLYVTVFREDDEAEDIWAKDVGVARERIFRRDEKDNFWAMGDTGPCGPCSEIHYDLGPAASELGHKDCKFPCPDDCGRYTELWNLVFMQFNRDEQGKLTPLPRPSIDTGAGLERLSTVLQGKISNFDTDLFRPLIDQAVELLGAQGPRNEEQNVSLRIIADHARAATFLISDGVLPSNEGRGYVLRLIIRRALYHGYTISLRTNEPFLFKMSSKVVELMRDAYPDLAETAQHVARAIKSEEERYAQTTQVGLEKLDGTTVNLHSGDKCLFAEWWRVRWAGAAHRSSDPPLGRISGADLFKLHDTYGLRPDFVEDVVRNYGLTVDREGYETEMQRQRERARASWKAAEKRVASPVYQELADKQRTVFDGYTQTTSNDCRVIALFERGQLVNDVEPGVPVEIILDHTPFYAESGGQVGDRGRLLASSSTAEVADISYACYLVGGLVAHVGQAREKLVVGDRVTAAVDAGWRGSIRRSHTATHLLHAALRSTLGTHVKQAGSLVAPDRLRFDFTHYAGLVQQDWLDIEDLVNEHVLRNEEVQTEVTDLDAAIASGAMALFGEKYGDRVRVVSITDFSKELCGGTHVRRTGDIGLFKIVSESSVAAGTRRIEALTGQGIIEALRRESETLALLSGTLRAKPDELLQAAEKLTESEKKLRKELASVQRRLALEGLSAKGEGSINPADRVQMVKGVRLYVARANANNRPLLRDMAEILRRQIRMQSGVIVLASVIDDKAAFVASVSKDLIDRLDAAKIVREAAVIVEGTGGGRKDLAEAGGKSPEKLDESLKAVPSIVERML